MTTRCAFVTMCCRNQFEMELRSPPKCSDNDCACKLYSEGEKNKGYLTVKLWKGFYHDVYSEIAKVTIITPFSICRLFIDRLTRTTLFCGLVSRI